MKRLRIVLFILALSVSVSQLTGLDHLELMTTLYGEFYGSHFGAYLVAMNFNGDNYDDLIVYSMNWNPYDVYQSSQRWGKFYFYWGSANGISSTPDFIIEASANGEYSYAAPINGGDINSDGLDDLVLRRYTITTNGMLEIYYGSNTPSSIPDLIIDPPELTVDGPRPTSLGDINGDSCNDIAFYTTHIVNYVGWGKLRIWTGVDNPWYVLSEQPQSASSASVNGVGDINHDGCSDFILQYGTPEGEGIHDRIVLYYGSSNFPECDSLVITEDSNMELPRTSSPLGDLNGDGFADFETFKGKVWFGDSVISPNCDLTLNFYEEWHNWGYPDYNKGNPFIFGDINGDGYDDVIGSSYLDTGSYTGEVAIWVGGPNMNGLIDMYLGAPSNYQYANFGWAKAAGDFNGDGLCDLAVSAPIWGQGTQAGTEGRVYVYSGNTALVDPIVANADPVETEPPWVMSVYPNPFNPSTTIAFNIPETGQARVSIYNSKGQRVIDLLDTDLPQGDHSLVWDGRDANNSSVASGIYFIKLESGGKTSIRKAMLVK